MSDPTLPNEEAAEFRTNIEGWICKTCRRFYGKEEGAERTARFCCEKDHKCDSCDGRAKKSYIYCDPCIAKRAHERFLKVPVVEWDGETPLVTFDDDRYFFDADSLADWLAEEGIKIEDAKLVLAEEDSPPLFKMSEFLCDYLCDDNRDQLEPTDKIDKAVNRWIEKNTPTTWLPSNQRPSIDSLRKNVPESEKSED